MRVVLWALAALGVLVAVAVGVAGATSLSRQYDRRREEAMAAARADDPVLTEADIAALPAPVRRYVAASGALGKRRTSAIELSFDAEMFEAPGAAPMAGPVRQYERFDLPRRLFSMSSRMKGLPVAVLHDFNRDRATMRVRLAGLVDVVSIGGEELTRTETVTILNDLCFFAPSLLADPRLTWRAIDDRQAAVSFSLGRNTVSAVLTFNDADEMVDFRSEDRSALQKDGSLRKFPWTTPMRAYREIGGRRMATEGEAIWHYPEGPFVYGRMRLVDYRAD